MYDNQSNPYLRQAAQQQYSASRPGEQGSLGAQLDQRAQMGQMGSMGPMGQFAMPTSPYMQNNSEKMASQAMAARNIQEQGQANPNPNPMGPMGAMRNAGFNPNQNFAQNLSGMAANPESQNAAAQALATALRSRSRMPQNANFGMNGPVGPMSSGFNRPGMGNPQNQQAANFALPQQQTMTS